MHATQEEIDERTKLAGNNKFELLLFKLGHSPESAVSELFGINVFKVREILVMPKITVLPNAHPHFLGVADIRGQIIPVINLPAVLGCELQNGLAILIVTEFGRTVQAFAIEEVTEIVRLDWEQVLPLENSQVGSLITGIARVDGNVPNTRLAQVLDVEQILRNVMPRSQVDISSDTDESALQLPPGTSILVADDSALARSVIEEGLKAMGVPFIMTKTGKEAWNVLQDLAREADSSGTSIRDRIALVLTDLEMPEMDGFTLTRLIKSNAAFRGLPVVIHSSLTGATNEKHVKTVGADGYVAKFAPRELSATLREALAKAPR